MSEQTSPQPETGLNKKLIKRTLERKTVAFTSTGSVLLSGLNPLFIPFSNFILLPCSILVKNIVYVFKVLLTFLPDNSNPQPLPPNRWQYPTNEQTYNAENYNAVKEKDKITTKIFWDVK